MARSIKVIASCEAIRRSLPTVCQQSWCTDEFFPVFTRSTACCISLRLCCRSSCDTISIYLFLCLQWLLMPDTNIAKYFAGNLELSSRSTCPNHWIESNSNQITSPYWRKNALSVTLTVYRCWKARCPEVRRRCSFAASSVSPAKRSMRTHCRTMPSQLQRSLTELCLHD